MHISYLSQTCEFTYLVDVSQKSLNPPRGLQDGMKRRKALLSQQQVLQKTLESMQSYQEKLSKAESHLKETKVKLDKSCWAICGVNGWGGALCGTVKHMWLPAYSPQKNRWKPVGVPNWVSRPLARFCSWLVFILKCGVSCMVEFGCWVISASQ